VGNPKAGTVDFDQFMVMVEHQSKLSHRMDEIDAAFSVFDMSGDGYLSTPEVKRAMAGLNMPVDQRTVDEMMSFADVEGTGQVSLTSFKMVMLQAMRDHR
jgi:calmodulin